ncbi:MAG TPA: hypothetical protein VJ955_08620, partial [Desulfuromonadales bacterium]|nr:hypothetical protein [Desulfuromonadales bacterium]
RPPASAAPMPKRSLPDDVFGRLRQACAANDPKAVGKELLSWAKQRWPQKSVVSLEDVGALGGPELEKEIHVLSACLYGREAGEPWQGNPLWQALEALANPEKTNTSSAAEDLEPLYKL